MRLSSLPVIALVLTGAACAALPAAAPQGADARWWVYFESRESSAGKPPRLVLTTGRRVRTVKASQDASILSYLPDRVLGSGSQLPVGMNDQNRMLVRFDLPKTLRKVRKVQRGELVLDMKLSKLRPRHPFEIRIHQLLGPWQETSVTWNRQPRFREQPELAVSLLPKAAEIRLDVTEVVNAWLAGTAPNQGLLVKMGGVPLGTTPLPAPTLARDLLATVPWENDVEQARKLAAGAKRLVLACVRGVYRPSKADPVEQLLQALVFTDPLVVALVKRRFVPLRVAYRPTHYTHGRRPGRDPLAPLGGDCTKIKAPALCVSTPDGKLVATLQSLGTFDAAMVHAFLRRALASRSADVGTKGTKGTKGKSAEELLERGELAAARAAFGRLKPAAARYGQARVAALEGDHDLAVRLAHEAGTADARVQGGVSLMRRGDFQGARSLLSEALAMDPAPGRAAEAIYYLGCLQMVLQEPELALAAWTRLRREHPQSLWALRATARLAWPGRLGPTENLRAVPLDGGRHQRTEHPVTGASAVRALVHRAVRYLLLHQRPDGSWTVEVRQYHSAITALIAKALLSWSEDLEQGLAAQAGTAVNKACAWLEAYMREADPKQASTFGATYMLDLFLARHAADPSPKNERAVNKAIRFLLGGQCPDGAWSYSYQFGVNWKGGFGGWPRTDQGRTHSMNTGPALVFLTMAKAAGFPVRRGALEKAAAVLEDMREDAGVYTYTYPLPLNFRRPDQSIARGPVCEQALLACGKVKKADLAKALATFMKYRAGLRAPVKLDSSWATPHAFSSYFYFYAYYHAVLATHALGGPKAANMLKEIRSDILAVPELDATWVDYHQLGKPYGTAMALLILKLTEG